jgi:hypothetical protein
MLSEIEDFDQEKGEDQITGKLNREIQMNKELRKFSINRLSKNTLNSLDQVDRIDECIQTIKKIESLLAFDK